MVIAPEPLINRKRDTMFEPKRKLDERQVTSAKMSRNSQIPGAKTPILKQATRHKSTVPEIHFPDDDELGSSYDSKVIPPTPNRPGAEILGLPKEEQPFPRAEDDEALEYHVSNHLNKAKVQAKLRVVETGTGREIRCDQPLYCSSGYRRR